MGRPPKSRSIEAAAQDARATGARPGPAGASGPGSGEATRPELRWEGKRAPDGRAAPPSSPLELVEVLGRAASAATAGGPCAAASRNQLIHADNRRAVAALLPAFAGEVALIYMDPPFATGGDFSFSTRLGRRSEGALAPLPAYRDTWARGPAAYLSTMLEQLELLRELLSEQGTLFVHCDWRVSHWMRCLLDEVFGPAAFKNEIVWRYRRWPARTRVFQRMHDVLFWYGKRAGDGHRWTPQFEALAPSTLATFGTRRQVADFSSGRRKPSQTDEETPGAPLSDVWDIGIIAPIAHERVGYPTQKPEALLRRVLTAASAVGDLVLDPFCGSGTTLAVAEALGRRWIGCDASGIAVHTTKKRLLGRSFAAQDGRADRGCAPFEVRAAGRAGRLAWRPRAGSTEEAVGRRYGADPWPDRPGFARKGAALVRVVGAGEAASLETIGQAAGVAEAEGFPEVHVLAWEWALGAPDRAAALFRGARLFTIPPEVLDEDGEEPGLRFAPWPAVGLTRLRDGPIRLAHFRYPEPPAPEQAPHGSRAAKAVDDEGSDLAYVDLWAVDWEDGDAVFTPDWHAVRAKPGGPLQLETSRPAFERAGPRRVVVEVVDLFGSVSRHLLSWSAKR